MRLLLFSILLQASNGIAQPDISTSLKHLDINKDGLEDIVLFSHGTEYQSKSHKLVETEHKIIVLYGTKDGPLKVSTQKMPADSMHDRDTFFVKQVNLNNDGYPDFSKMQGEELQFFYGSASGYPKQPNFTFKPDLPKRKDWSANFFDYNGDGYEDIILQSHGYMPTYSTNLTVNFKTELIAGSVSGFSRVPEEIEELKQKEAIIITGNDFNNDGRNDALITYGYKFSQTMLWMGRSGANVLNKLWNPHGTDKRDILSFYSTGDINGDGRHDLICFSERNSSEVRKMKQPKYQCLLYTGTNDGLSDTAFNTIELNEFSLKKYYSTVYCHKAGDMDGDGYNDLIIENEYGQSVYHDKGTVLWGGAHAVLRDSVAVNGLMQFANNHKLKIIPAGDINGDKRADLVLFNDTKICFVSVNRERKFTIASEVEW